MKKIWLLLLSALPFIANGESLPLYEIQPYQRQEHNGSIGYSAYLIDRKRNRIYQCGVGGKEKNELSGFCRLSWDLSPGIEGSMVRLLPKEIAVPEGGASEVWILDQRTRAVRFCPISSNMKCIDVPVRD